MWMHASSAFCTQHGSDFVHSASARTKRNLEQAGLGESRLHCFICAVSNICDLAVRFWVTFSETDCLYHNLTVTAFPSWNRRITCSLKSFSFPPTNRRALDFTTSLRSKCLSGITLWPCQIEVHTCCIRDACVSVSLQVCYTAGRVEQNLSWETNGHSSDSPRRVAYKLPQIL
jgi:hypothetical protein